MYSGNSTTNAIPIGCDYQNCPYRLPCGYCTKLYQDCPKQGNSVTTPYWGLDKITCSEENNNG